MLLGFGVTDIGRRAGRHVGTGVVTGLVARQREQTHQGQRGCRRQNGAGPADDGGADPPPAAGSHRPLGFEDARLGAQGEDGRPQCERGEQRDQDAQRGWYTQALKVGQPGEAQTRHRAGNGEARPQHDVGGSVIHGVERLFAIFTSPACFLVAANEKYCVVRSGGDHQQRQDIRRVGRQPDYPGVSEKRDKASRGGHFDEHGCEHQQRGQHRAVDEKQHQRDRPDGDPGDLCGALAAHVELIGDQWRRPGDVGLDARRRFRLVDDVAKRAYRLVGQRRALITRKVHLNIGGLAVGALGSRRGQGVAPVVLNVLDVFAVLFELADQRVVIPVGVGAQRLITFQDDHGRAVGVELMEHVTDALDRLEGGSVGRVQCDIVGFPNLLQLRHRDVRQGGQRYPKQQDRQREPADGVRYERPPGFVLAQWRRHPDLSRQKV